MAAGHGGARVGAGRPEGAKTRKASADNPVPARFDDPLSYLIAVATGETAGDALRVAAAKAALPWTTAKKRAPVESPAPRALRAKTERDLDAAVEGEWQARAAKVRERLAKPKKGNTHD